MSLRAHLQTVRIVHPAGRRRSLPARGLMVTGLAITLLPFTACTADSPTDPTLASAPLAAIETADTVEDLAVIEENDSSITVGWTQVDDGTGEPARYRLKFAAPPIDWSTAAIACDQEGTGVGADLSCTVEGLEPGTAYDFQLMSYRLRGKSWQGAVYSNVATAETTATGVADAEPVQDLTIRAATDSTLEVGWTQVDDGTGNPARYRLKYASPPIDYSSASTVCDVVGDEIGGDASCTVEGLETGSTYDVQLMSYRLVEGTWSWVGATSSNVATGEATSSFEPTETGDTATVADVGAVGDLQITASTETSLSVRWTQVDDGTGGPARYRVKYGVPPIDYSTAWIACDVDGDQIGGEATCIADGLDAGTTYDIQLMSYRLVEGTSSWESSAASNVVTAGTESATSIESSSGSGIWISPAEIAALPTSGSAWNNLLSEANSDCGIVDLSDQTQMTNVCVMAKALAFARTGDIGYRTDVVTALTQITTAGIYTGRALALGRELAAYVIAADLIDLKNHDPLLDELFRTTLVTLRTTYTTGAASDLIDCHESRPNNWGAHCGATRAAIAVYLGDTGDLERTAQVFKGYLGDRSSYAGFAYGGPSGQEDLSWQCDESRPVGINPKGCVKDGLRMDGILADDQRRGGSFTTDPPKEGYVWEALQGLLAQAVILHRAGYDVWEWEDRALLRAVEWLHEVVAYPAEGDDTWQPHVVNHYYGTSFPAPTPARAGKNVGWTDWTHR